jgi:hypothetical protein
LVQTIYAVGLNLAVGVKRLQALIIWIIACYLNLKPNSLLNLITVNTRVFILVPESVELNSSFGMATDVISKMFYDHA